MRPRNFYHAVRLGVGLGCLFLLGGIPALAADLPTPPPSLAVVNPSSSSPAFELPHAQGTTIRSADLQGKVVVVRFWATWWSTCRGELPSVQKAHETLQDKDVVFLAISIDGGGADVVKPFVATHAYTFPVLIDARMEVARAFGARALPTTYVIDRNGQVVAGGLGPVEFDSPEFMQYIAAVMAQPRS